MEAGDRLACQISGKGEKKRKKAERNQLQEGWRTVGVGEGDRLAGSYDRTVKKKRRKKIKQKMKVKYEKLFEAQSFIECHFVSYLSLIWGHLTGDSLRWLSVVRCSAPSLVQSQAGSTDA